MAKYRTTTAAALGLITRIKERLNKGEKVKIPEDVLRDHLNLHRIHWANLKPGHDFFSRINNSGYTSIILIMGESKDFIAELNIAASPVFFKAGLSNV